MVRVYYVLGTILLWAFVQADVTRRYAQPAIIEDLRVASGSRIVAGWPAAENQLPHQVSVRMVSAIGGVDACGGSIIHHQWVITAAHCVDDGITFVVSFGLTNLTRPEYVVETTRKYVHPEYDLLSGKMTDDIALLGLNDHIPYGPSIQPCRLQNSEQKNTNYGGVVLTVSGYGRTDDDWNGGVASEILLWTHLRGMTNEECRLWYSGSVVQDQTVCAGYYNDTAQSSCQGDSGGPLILDDVDGKPTLIGVVSFGSFFGCNSPYPSGFVRPGHYHDWFYEVSGINFDWKTADLATEDHQATLGKVNVVDA